MLVQQSPSRDNREFVSFSSSALSAASSPSSILWTVNETLAAIKAKSRTTLYKLERTAGFPRRVQVAGRNVAFLAHEVIAWIEGRVQARDTTPAVIDTGDTSTPSDQPVKRGRGRPRKVVVTVREG
jgi:predicted DNA-binding transcriptional regulator AlpA